MNICKPCKWAELGNMKQLLQHDKSLHLLYLVLVSAFILVEVVLSCQNLDRKELARTITALESQIQYCGVGVPWTYPTVSLSVHSVHVNRQKWLSSLLLVEL